MKKLAMLTLAAGAALPALGADFGVSITAGEPGVYGRLDIGDVAPPVVYQQPIVISPQPYYGQPIYMYVPVDQQLHWRYYCSRYNACGQPVYFVHENWVRDRWEREHRYRWRSEHERRDWQDRRDWDDRGDWRR